MRSSSLLLATAALCSANNVGCPHHIFQELVARTSCGDKKSISKCLVSDIDLGRLVEIEECYIAGGCSKSDAADGAAWFALEYWAEVQEEDERVGLRRRADSTGTSAASAATETTTDESTTAESTSAESTTAAATSTTDASTTADSTTTDSTTSDSTTASTTSASTASSTASTASSTTSGTTTSGSSSSSSTSSGTGAVQTGTVCSTTKTISTSFCSTSGASSTCSASTATSAECAPGNICTTNASSENVCMKIDNHIGVLGIVIAIVFGTGILGTALGVIILDMKAKRAAKKNLAEKEALLSGYPGNGKGRAGDVVAPQTSEVNLPLITDPGAQTYNSRRAVKLQKGRGALA